MKRPLIFVALILLIAFAARAQKKSSKDASQKGQDEAWQITEVSLERGACFGPCPIYKITIKRDGTAIYEGKRFVERLGMYRGTVYAFNNLARLIEASGYFKLKDNYSVNITDLSTATTSVVRAGKRKTIRNYGGAGPIELWGIETTIDGMVANTKWEKVSDK